MGEEERDVQKHRRLGENDRDKNKSYKWEKEDNSVALLHMEKVEIHKAQIPDKPRILWVLN